MTRYRVGRRLGRTLYRDDSLIGIMDRAEDAALVVARLNDDTLTTDDRETLQTLRDGIAAIRNGCAITLSHPEIAVSLLDRLLVGVKP